MSSKPLTSIDDLQSRHNTMTSDAPLDIPRLMAEIRARVSSEIAAGTSAQPFRPFRADDNRSARKAGELRYSEDLHVLNSTWHFASPPALDSIRSHRSGILGKFIVRAKRKLLSVLWESIFKHYFEAERNFHMHLVRYLNDVSEYVDVRDGANFWELVRKIDVDVTKALNRIEQIADQAHGSLRSTERSITDSINATLTELNGRLTEARAVVNGHESRLKTVESVSSGLEGIIARLTRKGDDAYFVTGNAADSSYLLLENRFRGSESEISGRQAHYVEFFHGSTKPVLDVGAGRGELVQLLTKANIPAYGVDLDRAMVEAAQARSIDVRVANGLEVLAGLEDGALGGVIAIQVVEHLHREQLQQLCELARRKVTSGGHVIFETINPKSLVALSSNYFRDPTHVWPMHPDTLSYQMTLAGLEVRAVKMLSPFPEDATLRPIEVEPYMTPRWAHTIERLNGNVARLNDLLFGHQDYAVIARIP